MFRLVRTFDIDADIFGLLIAELGQFRADLVEVEFRHFLVKMVCSNTKSALRRLEFCS